MIGDSPKPGTPESLPVLTFEEFSHRSPDPHYNNFFLHFVPYGEARRESDYYKRFEAEHPKKVILLFSRLKNEWDKTKSTSENLKPFDKDLYEAYKIMRSYGVSDYELFQ